MICGQRVGAADETNVGSELQTKRTRGCAMCVRTGWVCRWLENSEKMSRENLMMQGILTRLSQFLGWRDAASAGRCGPGRARWRAGRGGGKGGGGGDCETPWDAGCPGGRR